MPRSIRSCSTTEVIQALAEQVRQIERARRPVSEVIVSSGNRTLDRILPAGGFRPGSLVEWLAVGPGSGAATLALLAARQAAGDAGTMVVVDRMRLFYPPAAVKLGIDPRRLIVARPESDEDHAWALDQVLRSGGVAAVWCFVDRQDDHTWRRWQLAAESSGVLGLLVRGEAARHEPCWADLRLLVEPIARPNGRAAGRSRRLHVELLRSRTAQAPAAIELEIPARPVSQRQISQRQISQRPGPGDSQYETRTVHLASQLATAKTRRRSRGA